MKVLTNIQDKVNFVDQNNVVVGYDLSQDCCEQAGWYISRSKRADIDDESTHSGELESYVFDTSFFEEYTGGVLDEGKLIRFRLISEKNGRHRDLYLHLFNAQNGYYSHGFTVDIGGQQTRNDRL